MNRDQYAQKQRWLQDKAGAIEALQTKGQRADIYPGMAMPSGSRLSRSGADDRVAALLRRGGPGPALPGDEPHPIPRHFSHHPLAMPIQRKAPPGP